jgi:hypothetical protein
MSPFDSGMGFAKHLSMAPDSHRSSRQPSQNGSDDHGALRCAAWVRGSVAVVATFSIAACNNVASKQPASAEQARPTQRPAEPLSPARERLPEVAVRFKQRVAQLSADPAQVTPRTLAEAFRELSSNVATLSGERAAEPIRSAADELSRMLPDTSGASSFVLKALRAAGTVLLARVPADLGQPQQEARIEFEATLGRLDRATSVREGRDATLSALQAVTNLVYLTYDALPPFGVTDADATLRRLPPSFCARAALAADSVTALARASLGARWQAAEALNAAADALAVHPSAGMRAKEIQSIRFEASLLGREGAIDAARTVKLGLSRIVELMEVTFDTAHTRWINAARDGVDAIDPGFVTFERASIQDAFRLLVDAMLVAGRCATERRAEIGGQEAVPPAAFALARPRRGGAASDWIACGECNRSLRGWPSSTASGRPLP